MAQLCCLNIDYLNNIKDSPRRKLITKSPILVSRLPARPFFGIHTFFNLSGNFPIRLISLIMILILHQHFYRILKTTKKIPKGQFSWSWIEDRIKHHSQNKITIICVFLKTIAFRFLLIPNSEAGGIFNNISWGFSFLQKLLLDIDYSQNSYKNEFSRGDSFWASPEYLKSILISF